MSQAVSTAWTASPPAHETETSKSFGEFFRYHGWLAPGVRWFRVMGFRAKASWVALAFLIPLVVMLVFLSSAALEQIKFAQAERQGLTYVRPLLGLLQAAQERRLAAASGAANLAEVQDKVKAAFDKVQAAHGAMGGAVDAAKEFEALQTLHQKLLQAPMAASALDTFRAHNEYTQAVLSLVSQVSDGSQLTLDPDLDTYHMMNLSVLRGPVLMEYTARLRGMGIVILASKELSPEHLKWMARWAGARDLLDRDVTNSYTEGIASSPEAARLLDRQPALSAAAAFKDAVEAQIMGAALQGEADSLRALGSAAVDSQRDFNQRVMDRLDAQLQARIDRLWAALATQLAVALSFVALAAYLMLAFYKVMMGGLKEVSGHLNEITQGNLTTAPRPWGRDEAAQLMGCWRRLKFDPLTRIVPTEI